MQVKGFPWSCSAGDLRDFFSGESRFLLMLILMVKITDILPQNILCLPHNSFTNKLVPEMFTSAVQTVQHNINIFTVYILR